MRHVFRTSISLIASTFLLLSACGASSEASDDDRPVVLTTFTVLADIASNVAGEHLRVESITKVGAEIHGYEPTPSDLKAAAQADLVVQNGLNLEAWFEKFIDGLDVPRVIASTGVETISITDDAYSGMPNPHAWMSPSNVEIYVDNLAEAFGELDPENADAFASNAASYKAELTRLHTQLVDGLAALPEEQRALVSCEGAFSYLARDAGLTEKYIWPVNAEQQATPQQIVSAIEFVNRNHIQSVFCESTVNDGPMRQVAEATGANFGGNLYVDSLSESDGPVPTYVDLIRYNTELIIGALIS